MFTRSFLLVSAGAFLFWLGQAVPATAGGPKQFTFEEEVARADFVGIVECETAGLPVGKFKVIESCRGPKAGERIHIVRDVYYFAKSKSSIGYTLPLCGQRYLFTAVRAREDGKNLIGLGGPLAWRQLPIDFAVGFSGGMWENPDPKLFEQAKKLVAGKPLPMRQPLELTGVALPELARAQHAAQGVQDKSDATDDSLLVGDPSALVEKLINAPPEDPKDRRKANLTAYIEASQFAWKCGQDRQKYLRMLLTAKDPVVRVAGAAYLCFEDEKLGMKELAKLTDVEGEAGAWAALTLARRGQKSALPRLLDLFKDPVGAGRGKDRPVVAVWQWQLRLRSIELLSNSAHKSGVAMPKLLAHTEGSMETLQQWWQQNAERITLHDPWLEYLAKQKID